jgi:hypothetical protein
MRLGDAAIVLEEDLRLREERELVYLKEANDLEAGEPLSPPLVVRLGVSLVNNDVFLLGESRGGRDW